MAGFFDYLQKLIENVIFLFDKVIRITLSIENWLNNQGDRKQTRKRICLPIWCQSLRWRHYRWSKKISKLVEYFQKVQLHWSPSTIVVVTGNHTENGKGHERNQDKSFWKLLHMKTMSFTQNLSISTIERRKWNNYCFFFQW